MNMLLIAAGTTLKRGISRAEAEERDQKIIDQIYALVGNRPQWGCQVIMPPEARYLGPFNKAALRVEAAKKRASRLPEGSPAVVLNYEANLRDHGVSHVDRAASLRAVAMEVLRQFRYPAVSAYAVPRINYEGDLGPEIAGWIHEAYAIGTRSLDPTCYIFPDRTGHTSLTRLKALADMLGYRVRPNVSGQYRGKHGVVPAVHLVAQARDYREVGVEDVTVWCDINTRDAAAGVARCVEAFS